MADGCKDRCMVPREHVLEGFDLVHEVREGSPEDEALRDTCQKTRQRG